MKREKKSDGLADSMLNCKACELHYEVIFNADALSYYDCKPNQYCPRCGAEIEVTKPRKGAKKARKTK